MSTWVKVSSVVLAVLATARPARTDGTPGDDPPAAAELIELHLAGELDASALAGLALELDRNDVVRELTSVAARNAPHRERRSALWLAGETLGARHLRLAIEVTSRGLDDERSVPLAADLGAASARMLARGRANPDLVAGTVRGAPAPLRTVLVRAFRSLADADHLVAATGVLGVSSGLDLVALQGLRSVASRLADSADERVLVALRPLVRGSDDELASHAMRILGALADGETIPVLVEQLEHRSPVRASSAHAALVLATRLPFDRDPVRWRSWLGAERAWFAEEAPEVLDTLESDDVGEVARALNVLASHALWRHGFAERAAALIDHSEPDIRVLACAVCGQLRSTRALEALVDALYDADERVAFAAEQALGEITGQELGNDPRDWSQSLSPDARSARPGVASARPRSAR